MGASGEYFEDALCGGDARMRVIGAEHALQASSQSSIDLLVLAFPNNKEPWVDILAAKLRTQFGELDFAILWNRTTWRRRRSCPTPNRNNVAAFPRLEDF